MQFPSNFFISTSAFFAKLSPFTATEIICNTFPYSVECFQYDALLEMFNISAPDLNDFSKLGFELPLMAAMKLPDIGKQKMRPRDVFKIEIGQFISLVLDKMPVGL